MLFNSVEFVFFFLIVLALYYLIPVRARYLWLLGASYVFYMGWNPVYVLLLMFITGVTYINAQWISIYHDEEPRKTRKLMLIENTSICLLILFYYKYTNFLIDLCAYVLPLGNLQHAHQDILLPVGISFFTFQAMSYTFDVYSGKTQAEPNFLKYALFVSFFPQLLAGPIERSGNLLKQINRPKKFSFNDARDGFLLMLWGFFLKIVIADRAAVAVNTVYSDIGHYEGWYLIFATFLFGIQIYCDFAGYSVIAIGCAKILGFQLMENFDAPYLADSIADFWRRWHISLSTWFRDYVYIPLGGNRKGFLRKQINRMIVFLLSGLWHGANLTFVAWGCLHGLYQIVQEILLPVRRVLVRILHLHTNSIGYKVYRAVLTFLMVNFAWIFFRAENLHDAAAAVRSVIHARNPWIMLDGSIYNLGLNEKNMHLLLAGIFILLAADILKAAGIRVREVIARQDYPVRWIVMVFAIWFILTFGIWGPSYQASQFIYFQF